MVQGPILLPLDGSQLAEQAVPLGASIARQTGRSVILLSVIPHPSKLIVVARTTELTAGELVALLHDEAERYLQGIAALLEDAGLDVSVSVVEDSGGEAIVSVADAQQAGYVVMTTHGYSGIRRWALGSVAHRVLHLAHCPLILLRPREMHDIRPLRLPLIDRILVALDGSEAAERVVPHAAMLARAYDAELLLMRVLLHPPPRLPEPSASMVRAAYEETVGRAAREYLAGVAAQLADEGLAVRFETAMEPVAGALLQMAREQDADLVAMTSHAHEDLGHTILGSITDRVVRAGEVPVLIVRP